MNHQAIADKWVQDVVIDLGFCPFAWQSIQEKRLSCSVILDSELEKVLEAVMEEILILEDNEQLESSLITVPNAFETFDEFLEAVEILNRLLVDSGYEGVYQFASFHPLYQFAGTEIDDPSNFTNRSPFPIFHAIRESAMSTAIAAHPNIDAVPNNNIEKTRSLGLKHMQSLFHSCFKIN